MMRLNRFALVAGVLALGVAACGDDVEIVQPTPEPPPPPPPVEATMAPASASVAVGNSVVFAVNASGGVAGEAASWTCASSNTGIATVGSTSAGCSATGVAAGDVTITASVSKSGETVNVGAQLTVTADTAPTQPGDPAFLVVASIEGDDGSDTSGLQGRVSVTVNVERGDQELEELSLLVDGTVVASQSFGGGMMDMTPPADEAAEQAVHAFTMSFDSHDYDRDSGAPVYANGEHTISAELEIGVTMADGMHGHETVSSNAITVEFDNDDFIAASVGGLGDGAMNEESGQVWHGGPDVTVEISALPVLYSSGAVSSLTLLSFCGDDAATDSEAPFSFTLDCDGYTSDKDGDGDKPSFTVGGGDIDVRASAVYLDFDGPPAPHFNPNPNGREDGWVNPTVDFLGKFHATRNKEGWLNYNDDGAGVGGYAPQLRFSSTTPSIVDGAREAAPNVIPTEPTRANAACVIATAVDLLGNESGLPTAGSPCVTHGSYVGEEDEDGNMNYPAGLRAGLDVSPPTIAFSPASPRADASSLKEFQVQVADPGASPTGRSGLHSTPVLSRVDVRDADNDMLCGDDDDVKDGGVKGGGEEAVNGVCELAGGADFNAPLATTSGLSAAEAAGYYTFTAVAQDKAGNKSEAIVRTAVNDDTAPELGLIVGGYDKGSFSLTATLTDNLSLKSYWAEAVDDIGGATGVIILPREGSVMVDEYNSPELTQSVLTTPPLTMRVFRALQATDSDAAVPANIDMIRVVGTDHGGMADTASTVGTALSDAAALDRFGVLTTANTGLTAGDGTGEFDDPALTYERDKVFQTFTVVDDEDDDDMLELRATITGTATYVKAAEAVTGDNPATPDVTETDFVITAAVAGAEGLVNNPVSRVDFYAFVALKGGDGTGVSTATDPNDVPPVPDGKGETDAADDNEALVFLGSASAAGAEDDATAGTREYTWGLDMSGAEFVEIAGGEGDYTIVAIAVNSAGVAISANSIPTTVEK